MKLLYSPTSPYARKVRLTALEKGVGERLELVVCNPFENGSTLAAANPLNKVPALILDDGVLYDSRVICEYLDSLTPEPRLIPELGAQRWSVLCRQALADGVTDAAFAVVMEGRRPAAEQSTPWIERWMANLHRGLKHLEGEVEAFAKAPTLDQLAVASALSYLDLRFAHLSWRDSYPRLGHWLDAFAERPSMAATRLG
ncbi:MAG: glutathione S-transferase N-terminal domain-containing protein [Candidatus Competibacterales bacterium]